MYISTIKQQQRHSEMQTLVIEKNGNFKKYYEIDHNQKVIVLLTQWGTDYPETVRYTTYGTNLLGSFSITKEEEQRFNRAVKRIEKKSL